MPQPQDMLARYVCTTRLQHMLEPVAILPPKGRDANAESLRLQCRRRTTIIGRESTPIGSMLYPSHENLPSLRACIELFVDCLHGSPAGAGRSFHLPTGSA